MEIGGRGGNIKCQDSIYCAGLVNSDTYILIIFPHKYGLHTAGFHDVNTREYLKPNSFTSLVKLRERFTPWITKFFKIFSVASSIHISGTISAKPTHICKQTYGKAIIQTIPSTAVFSSTDISARAQGYSK
jgi:hypothetical protein